MTNGERYKDDILRAALVHETCGAIKDNNGIIIVDRCNNTPCCECLFRSTTGISTIISCREKFISWVGKQFIDVDWEGVPLDTKILVSHDGKTWICAHFAEYNKSSQLIGAWMFGKTSFTIGDKHNIEYYSYAKLYKGDENNG